MTIFDGGNQLQRLAIKLFSVSPNSASCERQFSSLGWLLGKRRQRLKLESIESLGKIHRYTISNVEKELGYLQVHNEEFIKNLVMVVTVNNENQYNDNIVNDMDFDDNITDDESDSNVIAQNSSNISLLNVENIIDLVLWVVIDPTYIPQGFQSADKSDDNDESDFDVNTILNE